MAEDRWKGTMRNIDFGRVDLAFVDYLVTSNILIQGIPDNKDFPELYAKKQQYDAYSKLRSVGLWCVQVTFSTDTDFLVQEVYNKIKMVEDIKAVIVANNK